jgi:hypothetical protein
LKGGDPMLNAISRKIAHEKSPNNSSLLCVAPANGEFGVYAAHPINAGQIILRVEGERRDRPSRYSVQVGWNVHIDVNGSLNLEELMAHFPWRFMNHSCDANCRVRGDCLVAVRPIRPGEEVTFNYNATEYAMACQFICRCGSPICVGQIRGYKYLAPTDRERLRPLLNLHLQSYLKRSRITVGDPVSQELSSELLP